MLGPIEQLCTTTTKLPRFHCNLKSLLGEGAQTSRINPPTMRGIRMVSVICQCRNSWMHEVSRRFTLPGFNPSRGPMPQLQARGFHFDFPSILHEGKKEGIFLYKSRKDLYRKDSFPDFFFRRYRSNVIDTPLTLYLVPIFYRSVWERNLPFCFLYKFSNTLFRSSFLDLCREFRHRPIRFLLASIPEGDRLDDLPSMWKQKKVYIDSFEKTCPNVLLLAWKKT